jgi:COP9 signalosome complex subunit 1
MSSKFDLESYISNYTGYTKIKRLLFIATKSPELQRDAITLALKEIQKGINTQAYKEVFENFKEILYGEL